jgi:ABC-type multidrug transport system fused ATPase/permease subunit
VTSIDAADSRLDFLDVTYHYAEGSAPALSGVNLHVGRGETLALVGASGAGKSTLSKALLRYFDVDSGRITIGGHDIRTLTDRALRDTVSVVPQEVYLLNASVYDNIAMARPDASQEQVYRAAEGALAHQFIIDELDHGYDTVVGEWGAKLSGGQRQRIAVARALLRDTPILVMDEPSSNLDAESESDLQSAMERVRHGRTTLLIAHRLSTIRIADRIAVLDHGRIVQTGSHYDLCSTDGPYRRLMSGQLAQQDPLLSSKGRR